MFFSLLSSNTVGVIIQMDAVLSIFAWVQTNRLPGDPGQRNSPKC